MQTLLYLAAVLMAVASLGSLRASAFSATVVLALSAIFIVMLAQSRIVSDDDLVMVKVPYGRFGMKWSEVETIVTNGTLLSFQGNGKRLSVSLAFAGKGRQALQTLIDEQVKRHQITIQASRVVPATHKDSRIGWF
jgi:hypothetical protein